MANNILEKNHPEILNLMSTDRSVGDATTSMQETQTSI